MTLVAPFKGRKKYKGLLEALGEGWRLVFRQAGGKVEQALDYPA